jgi:hypothetical protein
MNFGIVTSYVIGGLMMLSILAFNVQLSSNSQETTISTITQQKMNNIVEIISFDLERVGYNNSTSFMDDPIMTAENYNLEFKTSDGNIRWYSDTDDDVAVTPNPNDYYLYREDATGAVTKFPVVHFKLTYFDKDDDVITDISTLFQQRDVSIQVELIVESGEPASSTIRSGATQDTYHRTVWKRTFAPSNINKPWY